MGAILEVKVLPDRLAKRIADKRVLRLIRRYLQAGILAHGVSSERHEGTPQGGPLLDEVDRELERRGHRFVRYADDCNVYVRSRRAGERVLHALRGCYARLALKVNESKTAVASVWGRKFLGYCFWAAPAGEAPIPIVSYHRCTMFTEPELPSRRDLLHVAAVASMLAAAGLLPRTARAQAGWNRAAFGAKGVDAVVQALGVARPVRSPLVTLQADDLSENGAQVPVAVASSAPRVQRIALLVEKNPNTLAAVFELSETVEPALRTNIKIGESSNVYAVAITADGQVLYAVKHIGVTLGGCGE